MSEENNRGRPSKYKPEYCEQLIEHMEQGYSFDSFAGIVEVNIDTLYEWTKVHEEFSEAKKVAFSKCQVFWEKIGIDNILNKSETESFGKNEFTTKSTSLNASAWIFNMKNRFKWKDKQPDENDQININFTLAEKMAKARNRADKK